MKIGEAGISLIKQFEGCKLEAYQDSVGRWTIGYGDTGEDVVEGCTITQEEADQRLLDRLNNEFCPQVEQRLEVEITQNQFDALVSFTYNLGIHTLGRSTLLKKLNAGDLDGAAEAFLSWDMAGGKVLAGLKRRREAEKELFETA